MREVSDQLGLSAVGRVFCRPAVLSLLRVVGFCLLTAVAAQIRVPLPYTHVPMTLQSAVVVLAGLLLCPREAAGAMLLYVGLGTACGHIFAGSAGLFGPLGGYLAGFVAGAWVISMLRGRSSEAGWLRLTLAGAAGLSVLFACGLAVGAVWLGSLQMAVATGLVPFVGKAAVQLACCVAMVVGVRSTFRRKDEA